METTQEKVSEVMEALLAVVSASRDGSLVNSSAMAAYASLGTFQQIASMQIRSMNEQAKNN